MPDPRTVSHRSAARRPAARRPPRLRRLPETRPGTIMRLVKAAIANAEVSLQGRGATRWRNWAGTQACSPLQIHRPRTEDEIAAIVGSAAIVGERVKAVGSGHSFNGVALTDGHLLDLRDYARLLRANRSTLRATAQSGMTLARFSRRLFPRGLAMEDMGDIAYQTVAGAIATGTHGTGLRYGCLSTQVVGMRLVTADGSVVECSTEEDPEIFRAARVGVGALGVISTATFRLEPAFNLHAREQMLPLEEVIDALDEHVDQNQHFEFFWTPGSRYAFTKRNNRTARPAQSLAAWRRFRDDVLLANLAGNAAVQVGRVAPAAGRRMRRLIPSATREDYVDRSYLVFTSERKVRFHEMEYFIPREAAREAIGRVRALIERSEQPISMPIEVRFAAADDIPLSMCEGRATCSIAVHMRRHEPYEQYFAAVEAVMRDYDGRPHWGKLHFQRASTLRPLYPQWDRFQQARARVDPNGTFSNEYLDRVLGPVRG
ncbi:MAG: FAD-binding protein [Chloroflexi bacterium]|nr:FAD-binding protein [Chloroflexota bacterium]